MTLLQKNREKSRDMNLGRNNLVQLEGLIQHVNAGISTYNIDKEDNLEIPSDTISREEEDGANTGICAAKNVSRKLLITAPKYHVGPFIQLP